MMGRGGAGGEGVLISELLSQTEVDSTSFRSQIPDFNRNETAWFNYAQPWWLQKNFLFIFYINEMK